jgi:RNA polymerase sigma-70 factor, ECF subfamily
MSIESFYRASKQKFVKKLLPILKDPDLAEEILHDALVRALERYDKYDPSRASEETWFTHILFSTLWDWKRKQKRKVEIVEEVLEDLIDESIYPYLGEFLEGYKNTVHRKVFLLRSKLGYTTQEIALFLDLEEENVRKILQRLRKQL